MRSGNGRISELSSGGDVGLGPVYSMSSVLMCDCAVFKGNRSRRLLSNRLIFRFPPPLLPAGGPLIITLDSRICDGNGLSAPITHAC